jgi:hypothetical protein
VTQLIHCIYASTAAAIFKESDLPALLEHARTANSERALTGMLLYIEGGFFQVLEGDDAAVDDVYALINLDPRHSKVTLIIREPIAVRDFSEWTMGFSTIDPLEAGQLIGEKTISLCRHRALHNWTADGQKSFLRRFARDVGDINALERIAQSATRHERRL